MTLRVELYVKRARFSRELSCITSFPKSILAFSLLSCIQNHLKLLRASKTAQRHLSLNASRLIDSSATESIQDDAVKPVHKCTTRHNHKLLLLDELDGSSVPALRFHLQFRHAIPNVFYRVHLDLALRRTTFFSVYSS
ncbi:unnamed protein product [Albugo candida]|uniref:Uncharacterized protein n=1 Tax=Albugo candida TaxID=65357 RepID=A0A024G7H5_9STRA|nr:unnamed protein product [Albugo candida]|eukprot:CCI42485.1 unnamed protein product [Albugo candida]